MTKIVCKICNKEYTTRSIVPHVKKEHSLNSKEYYDMFKNNDEGYCEVCKKPTNYININKGYAVFCSSKCVNASTNIRKKIKQTFIKKYGVENPAQCQEVKDKIKNTCIEKYGVSHPLKNKDVKDKVKSTCIEKYGTNTPAQCQEIKDKIKKMCIEKYGVENTLLVKEFQIKKEQTFLEKYGGHPFKNKDVKDKIKNTCIEKYGVENPAQCLEIKDKIKNTCIEKYGTENPSQVKEFQIKRNQTFLENYGEHPLKNKEIRNKIKSTCIEKYGVESILQSEVIKDKIKNTCIEKYGVENPVQCQDIKDKIKNIFIKKYGVENSSQVKEFQIKKEQTFLEKYGGHPFKNKEVRDKIKNTCIEKYGVNHPVKSLKVKNKIKNTFLKNREPIIKENLDLLNLDLLSPFINGTSIIKIKCCKCNTIYETNYFNIYQGGGRCPNCYPKYRSIGEQEIVNFIKTLGFSIIENDREIIKPLELDIYLQEKKIAIEYNGLYWHSEVQGKIRNYHLDKLKQCQEKGITLIQIFEDEWLIKQDIVKNRLKQILNVSRSTRIHARKCIIKEIDPKIKNEFLEKYHLQGKDCSKIKFGAFHNEELVAVMTFSKGNIAKGSKNKEGVWELNRFCSNYNYHIPGIASKLLAFFKSNYEYKQIFSYADRRWSTGNVYYKLGFSLEKETQPNYWYTKGVKRIHRFNLRKRPDEPKDITESVLRANEGYNKIWDCGHLKFVLNN